MDESVITCVGDTLTMKTFHSVSNKNDRKKETKRPDCSIVSINVARLSWTNLCAQEFSFVRESTIWF